MVAQDLVYIICPPPGVAYVWCRPGCPDHRPRRWPPGRRGATPAHPDQDGELPAGGGPPPPADEGVEEVGIAIQFKPDSLFRGVRAGMVHAGLLELGEVVWYHPDFTIAEDHELDHFYVTVRTSAGWYQIFAVEAEKGLPGDFVSISRVEPRQAGLPSEGDGNAAPTSHADHSELAPHVGAEVRSGSSESPGSGAALTDRRSIRVDLEKLEILSNLVGELAVEKALILELVTRLEGLSLTGDARQFVQDLRRAAGKLSSVAGQLQEHTTELRMVPVGTLFRRFTRLVRDLQESTGKKLSLRREGEETMLDKAIAEEMVDPLLHLIRNAADHGIEGREERRQAGKAETGTILLKAYDQGDEVVIEVEDDGRGIAIDRERSRAVEKGLLTAEAAAALSDQEVLQLIFHPGFSTADKVTNISGRGVGMDVVRVNVERLRGTVALATTPGRGTRVTIRLPLTVSVLPVMLAQTGPDTVAVPMVGLRGLVRLDEQNRALFGTVLRHQGQLIPLVDLHKLWWQAEGGGSHALILATGAHTYGLVVDRPLGLSEVVVKPLGEYVGHLPGVAGAAILADGRVTLILDPATLTPDETQPGREQTVWG